MMQVIDTQVRARRVAHDRGFEAELTKLRAIYGKPAVEEALALAREDEQQAELREAFSISAAK
jgi:hypothetical protein